jgi:hypothetical protein
MWKTKGPHLRAFFSMELGGLEPPTSWVRWKRSIRGPTPSDLTKLDWDELSTGSVACMENERPAFAGLSSMELGGLEPPTSWVRSRRSPS